MLLLMKTITKIYLSSTDIFEIFGNVIARSTYDICYLLVKHRNYYCSLNFIVCLCYCVRECVPPFINHMQNESRNFFQQLKKKNFFFLVFRSFQIGNFLQLLVCYLLFLAFKSCCSQTFYRYFSIFFFLFFSYLFFTLFSVYRYQNYISVWHSI